ncbi:cisplatin damage response ATP-dependent DNA ligase [Chelatococcus sambhunathii]|uniref:DNA ligase (ATP) n=1 Tax=Chelatococcus sambhunathii TaxID=363953 RepID=A0ABU1DI26_9HYPH|nr:cisplatin damage response ATP-dependent DNA ligase [Chelatococcus sambhunathii]MDR4307756.1 cisplatin damage response ATP-dependent DNA ligase [Chelatococcus sambhunathii]
MNRFAFLLDRLAYEPRRNAKIRLIADYFRETPDPERGFALAALTGALKFRHAKPGLIRGLIMERTDPILFGLSYDFVGDLAETVALMWPGEPRANRTPPLSEIVEGLATTAKLDLPKRLETWLDALDETGRWALLKLITGSLRIGASARLAKTAVAALGDEVKPDDVELVWPGLEPPYEDLFAWVEGRGEKPFAEDPAPFRPPMLAHPLEDANFRAFDPKEFVAEWKWDGIRVQASAGKNGDGKHVARLWSRSGEDVSGAFPDLVEALTFEGAIDGELLILRDGRVQTFNVLQQRLNRKSVTPKLLAEFPAHIRAYDLLFEGDEDLRELPFSERRQRLEAFIAREANHVVDLSPIVEFDDWDGLAAARLDPASAGAGDDAAAVEGLMVKRRDSPYVVGRPKGLWFKWKHDPMTVDAVLMYAQRGHGKRSSFYSDYTFGLWRDVQGGQELVPVGKAYFGFTDEELLELDRFVRRNTTNRFGPVREVVHTEDQGLVLEVAFEGIARSARHKSGVAMRFPRVARIRWDKPTAEADRLESLEKLIAEREAT